MYFKKQILKLNNIYTNKNFQNLLGNFILIKKFEVIVASNEKEFSDACYNIESSNFTLTNNFIKKNKFLNSISEVKILKRFFLKILKLIICVVKFRKKFTIILFKNNKYHVELLRKFKEQLDYLDIIGIEYSLKKGCKKKKQVYFLNMTKFYKRQKKFSKYNTNIFNTLKNLFMSILIPFLVIVLFWINFLIMYIKIKFFFNRKSVFHNFYEFFYKISLSSISYYFYFFTIPLFIYFLSNNMWPSNKISSDGYSNLNFNLALLITGLLCFLAIYNFVNKDNIENYDVGYFDEEFENSSWVRQFLLLHQLDLTRLFRELKLHFEIIKPCIKILFLISIILSHILDSMLLILDCWMLLDYFLISFFYSIIKLLLTIHFVIMNFLFFSIITLFIYFLFRPALIKKTLKKIKQEDCSFFYIKIEY